jgi:CheY-like chemotaxis protein
MPTENAPPENDELSLWVARRMSSLMATNGVSVRQQAALLNEVCGISQTQARRKLHGAAWSFAEVLAVVRRFGASLDHVFAETPDAGIAQAATVAGTAMPLQDATFVMDTVTVPCRVRLGARVGTAPDADALLAAQGKEGWYVGTRKQLDRISVSGPGFHADQVLLVPVLSKPGPRIAVLDDDLVTAETLADWFEAAGYTAHAFTSGGDLMSSGLESHDAFVVDFLLAGGESSQAIIQAIRQSRPEAPIVLLTGKLRNGQASEAELATMLRTANVAFFEKPVRPSVLAATIEKELDQAADRRQP